MSSHVSCNSSLSYERSGEAIFQIMELFEASETQGLAKSLHEFWTIKNIYNDLFKQRMNTRNTFNREGWF